MSLRRSSMPSRRQQQQSSMGSSSSRATGQTSCRSVPHKQTSTSTDTSTGLRVLQLPEGLFHHHASYVRQLRQSSCSLHPVQDCCKHLLPSFTASSLVMSQTPARWSCLCLACNGCVITNYRLLPMLKQPVRGSFSGGLCCCAVG